MRVAGWVLGLVALVGCSAPTLPGEGEATPCAEVISGCEAQRLPNEVLRGFEHDGVMVAVDGFDTSGLLTFDEALAMNDYLGGGETVQVILGAANGDRLRWGTGMGLYYAVRWEGSCPLAPGNGPAGYEPPPDAFDCDATTTAVLDARTGASIVTGQTDPP